MSTLINFKSEMEQRKYMHSVVKKYYSNDYDGMTEQEVQECYIELGVDINRKVDIEEQACPEIQEQKRATMEGF